MSGADDVTVVWIAEAGAAPVADGARGAPPAGREDAVRALGEWGHARGLRIVGALESSGSAPVKIDLSVADRVEKELDRAREAIAALDADLAERALARAEATLREHAELPQAAWLRAEVHRSWAARWARIEPRDELRARTAWQDADALDGGRAVGIGEIAFPPRAQSSAVLNVQGGAGQNLVARLDGVALAPKGKPLGGAILYAIEVTPAEHHLVLSLDGDPVFASWVAFPLAIPGAPAPPLVVRVGADGACSAASLSGVAREGAGIRADGVACDRWALAAPAARRGAVLIARCARSACGPFLEWRSEQGLSGTVSPATPREGQWPGWATWTAVGIGAAAATTITLIATGVFEARTTETRFIAGGVRTE